MFATPSPWERANASVSVTAEPDAGSVQPRFSRSTTDSGLFVRQSHSTPADRGSSSGATCIDLTISDDEDESRLRNTLHTALYKVEEEEEGEGEANIPSHVVTPSAQQSPRELIARHSSTPSGQQSSRGVKRPASEPTDGQKRQKSEARSLSCL